VPKSTKVIKNFAGGWNCDADPFVLQLNELAVADNIDISPESGFETRKGKVALNSAAYDGLILRMRKRTQLNGTVVILGVYLLDSAYYLVKIGTAAGALTTLCTLASAAVSFTFYSEYVFFIDGSSYRYYDGSAVYTVKPDAPATSPTVTSASSGSSSSGTYRYAVTFVNDTGTESAPCTTGTITVSAGYKFNWTDIPIGGVNIKARKLYRSKAYSSSSYDGGDEGLYGDGDDALYYVDTIEGNSTTSYTDNVADSDLTTVYDDILDITPLTRCKYLIRHTKTARFFAAGDSKYPGRLLWSEVDKPGAWKEDSYYEPLTGGGSVIGLDDFADGVLVMYASEFYAWQGSDPGSTTDAESISGDVTWSRLPVDHGAVCNAAACRTPGTYSFLSLGGIWTVNSYIYSDVNVSIVETSGITKNIAQNKVTTELAQITNYDATRMIWDVPRQRLLLAYSTDAGAVADKILVYHWGIGAGFTRYTGLTVYDFCLLDTGELYISSGNTIYKMNTGTDDAGTAIEATVKTAFFDFDLPVVRKKLCKVFLNATSGVTADTTIDLQVTNGAKTVELHPITSAGIGASWTDDYTWDDTTTWIAASSQTLAKERVLQGILEGQSFQLQIFNSNLGERVKVHNIGMQYKKYKVKGGRT
jgi:hypothetical protein